jgi:hypothetical protein
MTQKRPLRERFLEKVQKTDSCWNWIGCKDAHGYGVIGAGGHQARVLKAHRVAYEIFVGPIPEGLCVLHHCDNPVCLNPSHLFLGTQTDNIRDMRAKKRDRQLRGEHSGRAKLTWEQVQEIRARYRWQSHEFGSVALGQCYGVSAQDIMDIVHYHIWLPAKA